MRMADVSQLPVIENGDRVVGILDESDVLLARPRATPTSFRESVVTAMTRACETLAPGASTRDLLKVLDSRQSPSSSRSDASTA